MQGVAFMPLMLKATPSMTLSDIGDEFGKRDHATVMSSIKKVTSVVETDGYYKEAVNNIRLNLKMA